MSTPSPTPQGLVGGGGGGEMTSELMKDNIESNQHTRLTRIYNWFFNQYKNDSNALAYVTRRLIW